MKKQLIVFQEDELNSFNVECIKAITFWKASSLELDAPIFNSKSLEEVSDYLKVLLKN